MLKAVREAKQHTSWINPDLEYEAALARFVGESLQNELFLKDLKTVMPRLVRLGMLNGLSQALVKVASPGVPDYYQGTELWDFSLVDPDNRRPVDFDLRKKLLSKNEGASTLLRNLSDGQAKLHVIRQRPAGAEEIPAAVPGRALHAALRRRRDGREDLRVLAFRNEQRARSSRSRRGCSRR